MYKHLVGALLVGVLLTPAIHGLTVGLDTDQDQMDDTYIHVDENDPPGDTGIYTESNGCPGLQTEERDCDGDGQPDDPDESLI